MDTSIFRNEFATVEVVRDDSANGERLLIRDLVTGREVYLDPLELEALTRASHSQFATWLEPDLQGDGQESTSPLADQHHPIGPAVAGAQDSDTKAS